MEHIGMFSNQYLDNMDFNTITLIHNQEKNLAQLLDSYSSQSIKPNNFIFVLDRCTDDSENMINDFSNKYNTTIIKNENGSDFMAGYCRDLAYSTFNNLPVIFLDGDCIPSPDLFHQFALEFERNKNGIVIGSRRLEDNNGHIDEDRRVIIPWVKGLIFNDDKNLDITNLFFAKNGLLTISCCLGITPSSANIISNINEKITGNRRIFSSSFDGRYGGEDDIVGLIAMFYNIQISSIATKHHVLHKWHESRKKEEFQDRINIEYEKIKEQAIKDNAPGLYNKDIDFAAYVQNFVFSQMMNSK